MFMKGVPMTIQELVKILYALIIAYDMDFALELFNKLIKHITL